MTLFKLECKTNFKSSLIWMDVVAVLTFGLMSLFPSMKDTMKSFDMSIMPKKMFEAFNISDLASLSTVEGFYGYYFQYIMIATGIYAAMSGAGALAKEEGDGTIAYLYAQPVSRSSIVASKLLAGIALYSLYWYITVAVSFFICLFFQGTGNQAADLLSNFARFLLAGWVMGLTFLSVGFLISSLLSSSKPVTSLSLGIVFLTYILGVVGKLQTDFKTLLYFSPVEAALPSNVFKHGIEGKYMVTDFIVIVICLLLTFWIYNRKDLKA